MPAIQPSIQQVSFQRLRGIFGLSGMISIGFLRTQTQMFSASGQVEIAKQSAKILHGISLEPTAYALNRWFLPTYENQLCTWGDTGFTKNSQMTYAMWIVHTGIISNWRNLFHVQTPPGADGTRVPSFWVNRNTTAMHLRHDTDAQLNEGINTTIFSPSLNTQHHLCITINNKIMRVYWNGTYSEQFTFVGTPLNAPAQYGIYASMGPRTIHANTEIGNSINTLLRGIRLFPRPLSDAQVLEMYQQEAPSIAYGSSYVLDQLSSSSRSGLLGSFGLKRMTLGYIGPTVRVRRQSDNAQSDFYGDVNGNLGTGISATGTSLAAWLNGSNAFVVTLYDQSGWYRNIGQATAASQPAIISYLSKWEIYFNGSTWLESPNTTDFGGLTQMSMATQFTSTSTTTDWQPIVSKIETTVDRHYGLWIPAVSTYVLWQRYGPNGSTNPTTTNITALNNKLRVVCTTSANQNAIYVNGSLNASVNEVYTYYPSTNGRFNIGGHGIFHVRYIGIVHDCHMFSVPISTSDVTVVST